MKNQANWAKSAASLCDEFSEEDGIDSKILAKKAGRKSSSYKSFQLCKEAGRTLSLVLTDLVNHPLLIDLQVVSVAPVADEQTLCVTVAHYGSTYDVTESQIVAELKQIQGILRCALARAINRKRTPQLTFRYAGSLNKEVANAYSNRYY